MYVFLEVPLNMLASVYVFLEFTLIVLYQELSAHRVDLFIFCLLFLRCLGMRHV